MRRERDIHFSKFVFMLTVWTRMAEVKFPHPLNFRERAYWVNKLFSDYVESPIKMKINYMGFTDVAVVELLVSEHEEFESMMSDRYSMARNGEHDYWADDTAAAWRGWLVGRGFDWEAS